MKKICIVTTLWSSINNWILPFLEAYHQRGVDVTVVCNMEKAFEENLKKQFPFVHTYAISFPRGISVGGSVKSIAKLHRFLKREKFDMVQYSTPNASLYGAVAAKMAKVPMRLYCQWGMVYVTMQGMKRKVFEKIERLVCRLSTHVQPDSYGNLEFCRQQGMYDETKSCVILNGSAKGLDLEVFDIQKKDDFRKKIRQQYQIPENAQVIGFVGRLGKEKGCNELLTAFQTLKAEFLAAKLLFVGPIEKEDTMDPELLAYFRACEDIIKTGRVSNVEQYMAAMDVFVLPSYREGFGMSVIEASAMGVPVVVTEYPGPAGTMEDGVTGYAVPVQDTEILTARIRGLLQDPEKAALMGSNGCRYVTERFDRKVFLEKYMENRMWLLSQ